VGKCQLEESRFHIYFIARIAKFRQRNDKITVEEPGFEYTQLKLFSPNKK